MNQVRIVIHPWMGGFSEQSETAFSIAFKAEGRMLRGRFTKTQTKKARRVVRQAGLKFGWLTNQDIALTCAFRRETRREA
jgi:glutamate mutase epsilon subunit